MAPRNAIDVEVLVQRADWVRALARALVRDEHEAEDLAQDAWVVALTHKAQANESWLAWIAVTMRNLARASWRSERHRDSRERDAARPEADPSSVEMLEQLDAHEVLVRAVRALDEPYRQAILLRYFEGLPPREIAARMDVPVKTIDTRLRRALEKLRARLDRVHHGERPAWFALLLPLARRPHVAGALAMSMKLKMVAALVAVASLLWFVREHAGVGAIAEVATPTENAHEEVDPASSQSVMPSERAAVLESPTNPATASLSKSESQPKTPLHIVGVVVDASGRPLADLQVIARVTNKGERIAGSEGLTNASGEFELPVPNRSAVLDVVAPNWVIVLRPRIAAADNTQHVFVLAPRRRLAGLVVEENAAPLPELEILCVPPHDLRASIARVLDLSMGESWSVNSDAAGAFTFGAVPDLAGCELLASAQGFEDARVELEGGDLLDLRVVLKRHSEPSKHLMGRVVNARGEPVEDAFIAFGELRATQTEFDDAARTNERGEFDLPNSRSADAARSLTVLATGFLPVVVSSTWNAAQQRETWPQPLEFVLSSAAFTIEGRVVRADGTPVRGAVIANVDKMRFARVPWATSPEGETYWAELDVESLLRGRRVRNTFTDERGHFELGGLLSGSYRLRACDPTTLDIVITDPIEAGSRSVEVRIASTEQIERIAGRVIDVAGEPVSAARVWLLRRGPMPTDTVALTRDFEFTNEPASTDAYGHFEFGHVSSLVAEIRVQIPDQSNAVSFPIAAIEDLEHVELTVHRACHFKVELSDTSVAAKTFAVLDAAGHPLEISESRGKMVSSNTLYELDEHGTVALLVLDSASVLVFYDEHGAEVGRIPVTLASGSLTIVRL